MMLPNIRDYEGSDVIEGEGENFLRREPHEHSLKARALSQSPTTTLYLSDIPSEICPINAYLHHVASHRLTRR